MNESANDEPPQSALRGVLTNEQSVSPNEQGSLRDRWRNAQRFTKIGAGACGEVYQMTGEPGCGMVVKRAKTGEYARQLQSDYKWHLRIEGALPLRAKELALDICVPWTWDFVDPASEDDKNELWWRVNRSNFPKPAQTLPEVALLSQRIMPLPLEARLSLIALYCPEIRQDAAQKDPSNIDSLIRVYLGKRRPERRTASRVSMFGLRNFQMYVDDFAKIGLDTVAYAVSMARTLALMHWEVRCDANDVEFVLGGARRNSAGRVVEQWMLDFNRVRGISMDADGVRLAVEAFMVNDRYFPRPLSGNEIEESLWRAFRGAYLEACGRLKLLQEREWKVVEWDGLPEAFVKGVVRAQESLLKSQEAASNRALE